MKISTLLYCIAAVSALPDQSPIGRLIKLGPDNFNIISENDKIELKKAGTKYIDLTDQVFVSDYTKSDSLKIEEFTGLSFASSTESQRGFSLRGLGRPTFANIARGMEMCAPTNPRRPGVCGNLLSKEPVVYKYPSKASHESAVRDLFPKISILHLTEKLTKLSSFYTRYYKSPHGYASARWLFSEIENIIEPAKSKIIVKKVHHKGWNQFSIVVRVLGQSRDKVIVGAHQDSTTFDNPEVNRAPGADDDGSGTVAILEALRVLVPAIRNKSFDPYNTIEFHFYSAEEAGLLGSIDIFTHYAANNEVILGMLQLDETGSTEKSIANGIEPHFGLMADYVSLHLNEFMKMLITTYNKIPYHETSCGYACSDHASALERGYPSTFVTESEARLTSEYIHSERDTVDRIDFNHIAEHVKLAVAYLYELGTAKNLY